MMTPGEHSLVISMLARQTACIQRLGEILKGHGLLKDDDAVGLDRFLRSIEKCPRSISDDVARQYRESARSLYVETGVIAP